MVRLDNFEPDVIIHDMHPRYESTKYAKGKHKGLPLQEIQHHYAHIIGVMAEKQLKRKVFGVAFDGTGYGDDGNLWGGEFMLCDYSGYTRVAHIEYFKLLGGAKAIKEPKRVALSLLFDLYAEKALVLDNPTIKAFSQAELKTQYIMWKKGLNAPMSSSVGRLFDAVASLTDVCHKMSFEGESGMLLEELYDDSIKGYYDFTYKDGIIDVLPIIQNILNENDRQVSVSNLFNTLLEMIAIVYRDYDDLPMVLSGGVFQNRVLLSLLLDRFPNAFIPNLIPAQ